MSDQLQQQFVLGFKELLGYIWLHHVKHYVNLCETPCEVQLRDKPPLKNHDRFSQKHLEVCHDKPMSRNWSKIELLNVSTQLCNKKRRPLDRHRGRARFQPPPHGSSNPAALGSPSWAMTYQYISWPIMTMTPSDAVQTSGNRVLKKGMICLCCRQILQPWIERNNRMAGTNCSVHQTFGVVT